jgi:hypothetical protein
MARSRERHGRWPSAWMSLAGGSPPDGHPLVMAVYGRLYVYTATLEVAQVFVWSGSHEGRAWPSRGGDGQQDDHMDQLAAAARTPTCWGAA